jgi:hypothetical protein
MMQRDIQPLILVAQYCYLRLRYLPHLHRNFRQRDANAEFIRLLRE